MKAYEDATAERIRLSREKSRKLAAEAEREAAAPEAREDVLMEQEAESGFSTPEVFLEPEEATESEAERKQDAVATMPSSDQIAEENRAVQNVKPEINLDVPKITEEAIGAKVLKQTKSNPFGLSAKQNLERKALLAMLDIVECAKSYGFEHTAKAMDHFIHKKNNIIHEANSVRRSGQIKGIENEVRMRVKRVLNNINPINKELKEKLKLLQIGAKIEFHGNVVNEKEKSLALSYLSNELTSWYLEETGIKTIFPRIAPAFFSITSAPLNLMFVNSVLTDADFSMAFGEIEVQIPSYKITVTRRDWEMLDYTACFDYSLNKLFDFHKEKSSNPLWNKFMFIPCYDAWLPSSLQFGKPFYHKAVWTQEWRGSVVCRNAKYRLGVWGKIM